jgi:hypothetical protein
MTNAAMGATMVFEIDGTDEQDIGALLARKLEQHTWQALDPGDGPGSRAVGSARATILYGASGGGHEQLAASRSSAVPNSTSSGR